MAEVTAGLVKSLRDKTGAGMMDCKKALIETAGDTEAAVDWLRKKGLAAAAKKSGRIAAEGLVGVAARNNRAAMVEINAETDFVARNEAFQEMVSTVADLALDNGSDVESLKAAGYPGTGRSVAEQIIDMIATIGENMGLRRTVSLQVDSGVVGTYVHASKAPGLGKIGVLIALETTGDASAVAPLAKQLAMHTAAANPQAISRDDVDPEAVARERNILAEQARASGKAEAIVEKMVEGRIAKYFDEVCLLDQTFVIDGETKVGKLVQDAEKVAGAPVKVSAFHRFALGEGLEKREEDFAAEVAKAIEQ